MLDLRHGFVTVIDKNKNYAHSRRIYGSYLPKKIIFIADDVPLPQPYRRLQKVHILDGEHSFNTECRIRVKSILRISFGAGKSK